MSRLREMRMLTEARRQRLVKAYRLSDPPDEEPLVRLGPDGGRAYSPPRRPPGFFEGLVLGCVLGLVLCVLALLAVH